MKRLSKTIRSTVHQFYFRDRSIYLKGGYSSNALGASMCEFLSFVSEIERRKISYAWMRAKQTKLAIYKYLFDRNCIVHCA